MCIEICFGSTELQPSRPKREKGKSILVLPIDYTMIDIETTGLDPQYDKIIEVGCIKYRSGIEIDRFHSLIQPPPSSYDGTYVTDFITSLTGITNEMLATAPNFNDISMSLWNFLDSELLVGHNVNFDINFLYDTFQKENNRLIQNDFLDTMRLARRCLPELKHHRLWDLDNYFNIGGEHHRSIDDCLITNAILEHLSRLVQDNDISLDTTKHSFDLRTIQGDVTRFLPDHILYDKYCVFTGKLERYSRKDAAKLVVDIGGHCENNVTQKTNFLIIGNFDYSPSVKEGKSTKVKKAERLILEGQDLQIISENVFYDLLSETP